MDSYSQESLEIVEKTGILPADSLKELQAMREELEESFRRGQLFRTRTEMEVSVLNDLKFPTPDSKYWQAVREQNVMFENLVMLSYEYRKNLVEIKKLQRDLANEKDELERELLQIEIDKKNFIAINQRRTAAARLREIREWHEIKQQLKPKLECGLDNPDDHQLVSYTQRWVRQYLALGEKGSPSERANLIGQLDMGLKECKKRGLLDRVLPVGSPERKAILAGQKGEL